ncbi:PD-(D/E)XK nuclease family protein [Desulfofalx alkaliphila]|uniref:PD-(D/E)XK nuclease family protein n=1 Tax=Desulfofalx alkaliphila TaxID=105483 RepID=UPI0004E212D3|nr:PD-(D/E)XK nuclease family protein [Desulfofalx alkaliphila]
MTKHDIKDLYFSQLALGAFDSCYLKFRRRYIDGLYWPGNWVTKEEYREAIELGQLFHLLAQRYYSGLPVGEGQGEEAQRVIRWIRAMADFCPRDNSGIYLPEQELRINREGLRLVAKYDLLKILPDGRAVIYDWKTNDRPLKEAYLAHHIQTILYRYLLVRAGGIYTPIGQLKPEDVSMVYWNPRYPNQPVSLAYNEKKYQSDEKNIRQKIKDIESRSYAEFYATSNVKNCAHCEYSPLCHGQPMIEPPEGEEDELELAWDEIEEYTF